MDRPKRKICKSCNGKKEVRDMFGDMVQCPHCYLVFQYNQAYDDFEKWLPSEDEIKTIMQVFMQKNLCCIGKTDMKGLAKAIRKRLEEGDINKDSVINKKGDNG